MPNFAQTLFISMICVIVSESTILESRIYKRMVLDAPAWSKYIYSTASFKSDSILECGSLCSSEQENCDVFAVLSSSCHIGSLANTNTNFLSAPQGTTPVHLNMAKMIKDINFAFHMLTSVSNETLWKGYIYKTVAMPPPQDRVDCAFYCLNVEKANGCELMSIEEQVCYLGKTSFTTGSVAKPLINATIYITEGALSTATNTIAEKMVTAAHWTDHIVDMRNGVATSQDCEGYTYFEQWHYGVYDDTNGICYLALLETSKNISVTDTAERTVFSNPNLLADFNANNFVPVSTNLQAPYVCKSFPSEISVYQCGFHCYFDANDDCDFFFEYNGVCYMGNFITASPIASTTATVTAYIFRENVHDMLPKLFPTSSLQQQTKHRSHISKTVEVMSELECAAFAALAVGPMDYYFYAAPLCYLGDLSITSATTADATEETIIIMKSQATNHINAAYNEQFPLSSAIWNKFIFGSVQMSPSDDFTECGVKCELLPVKCDFYAVSAPNCYFGDYSTSGATIYENADLMTFHKAGLVNAFITPFFWTWGNSYKYARWIYSVEVATVSRRCALICYYDAQCDFWTYYDTRCLYGRFSYSGGAIVSYTAALTLNFKLGNDDGGFIAGNYVNQVGNPAASNGLYAATFWGAGIFYTTPLNGEPESRCAKRCLVYHDNDCQYYFYGNGYCQLGRFTTVNNGIVGSINDNTVFKLRTDISLASLVSARAGGTNNGGCRNYGYRVLSSNGQILNINSEGAPATYTHNTYCVWAIYAPGAQYIKFELSSFGTFDGNDYLHVRVGMGGSAYLLRNLSGKSITVPLVDSIASEFIWINWRTNGVNVDQPGFEAVITRIG